MESQGGTWRARFQALFVTFLWSTSWIFIKVGLEEIPAVSFAGLRYALASIVLGTVLVVQPRMREQVRALTGIQWRRLIGLGLVFYFLTQGAMFVSLALLPAITLSLVLSFSPAAVALLSDGFLGEKLNRRQWAGIGCFVGGILVYFLPSRVPLHMMGLAVATVGLLANAGGSLLGRAVNRRQDLHPLVVTVVSMGVGALLLLATGLAIEGVPRLGRTSWAIVLWLAIVNTALAFTIWNHTLRRLSAVESSLINNTMLVQITILAWFFLGETVGLREVIGLVLAMLGVLTVQLTASEARPPEATLERSDV